MDNELRRRDLLRGVGLGAIGAALPGAAGAEQALPQTRPAVGSIKDLPTRPLGRIGIQVPVLSLGTAAMGHAFFTKEPFEEVTNAALDAGLRYIDTAPVYDIAQERLGPVLAKRRKEVFLVTKSQAPTRDGVLRDLEKSLKLLQADHADVAHIHDVGHYGPGQILGKGGALEGFLEARKRGMIKHIGCSGHQRIPRFEPVIETGEIALVMVAMNFVDRHTYNFEEKLLPLARKHKCAIACMKLLGGSTDWGGYRKREPGRLSADENRQMAFDYGLSIPGVSTLVVGLKSLDELRLAIEAVRNCKPLEGDYLKQVTQKGQEMAKEWKDHFGPVA